MRVSAEAVHDCVSNRGFIDIRIPLGDGQLGSHDDRLPLIAVFKDLQQGQPRVVVERLQSEVIEDDEVILLDMVDYLEQGSVELRQGDFFDELVHGEVFHPMPHKAGLPAQGTGQEGLPGAGLSVNEDVFSPFDERAVRERSERLLGQIPVSGAVHILQNGVVAKPAGFQV